MVKKVLITGIYGQDGSYLVEFLKVKKDFEIYGISPPSDMGKYTNQIYNCITIFPISLTNFSEIKKIFLKVKPDYVFNYASISSVAYSWNNPMLSIEVNATAVVNMLEVIRKYLPLTRFLQASSSEIFAGGSDFPQNEDTSINPISPYGISKALAHNFVKTYRTYYNLFCVNAILYNHESLRRPENFVVKKIVNSVARIKLGLSNKIELGNLNTQRDWGYAPDYVRAMYLMLENETPDDFIIATNKSHTLIDLLEVAFDAVGISDWSKYVKHNTELERPADPYTLQGDCSKIKSELGWKHSIDFNDMISSFVQHSIEKLK